MPKMLVEEFPQLSSEKMNSLGANACIEYGKAS